jgi:hypothetical protein
MARKTVRVSLLSVALVLGLSAASYVVAQTNPPLCHANQGSMGFSLIFPDSPAYEAHAMHGDQPAVNGQCGTAPPTGVPEPITMLLFGAGLAGVGYAKRRMGRKEA